MKLKMLVMGLALCGAVSMMKVCAEEAEKVRAVGENAYPWRPLQ